MLPFKDLNNNRGQCNKHAVNVKGLGCHFCVIAKWLDTLGSHPNKMSGVEGVLKANRKPHCPASISLLAYYRFSHIHCHCRWWLAGGGSKLNQMVA